MTKYSYSQNNGLFLSALHVAQDTLMRNRNKFNNRMTRIILLISFLFLFGRFIYSSIGAWYHHQDKKEQNQQSQQSSQSVERDNAL